MTHEEMPTLPKRRYNSARRQAQARETRRQIVKAAQRIFALHGYTGATMDAIAQEAGVSVETVYSAFGSKRTVLERLAEVAVMGDDVDAASAPLLDLPSTGDIQQLPDQRQQIRAFAHDTRAIMGRTSTVFTIMRGAAETEPEIASLLKSLLDKRLNAMRQFAHWMADKGPLRVDLAISEAADLMWALASPDMHHLLTLDRGWTEERYEQWLGDALIASLLPPSQNL